MGTLFSWSLVLFATTFSAMYAVGQQADTDQMPKLVHASGTMLPNDLVRLYAAFEGRIETVLTSTGVWVGPHQDIAIIADKEYAALMDAHSSTNQEVLSDRWSVIYRPSHIRCPRDCYILRSFVRSKQWVKPKAILFEVLLPPPGVHSVDTHLQEEEEKFRKATLKRQNESKATDYSDLNQLKPPKSGSEDFRAPDSTPNSEFKQRSLDELHVPNSTPKTEFAPRRINELREPDAKGEDPYSE